MKASFELFAAQRPRDPNLEQFAAVISRSGVRVARARHLLRAEDAALALDGENNFIGVVLPRLCTERSMRVEAERIYDALFGAAPVVSIAPFASRAALGGYDAVHGTIVDMVREARAAFAAQLDAEAARRRREAEGQAYLAALRARGGYGQRQRPAA